MSSFGFVSSDHLETSIMPDQPLIADKPMIDNFSKSLLLAII